MDKRVYAKQYRQTSAGKRSNAKAKWKFRGVKGDLDSLYDQYIAATHCGMCRRVFGVKGDGTDTFKVLHHNHGNGKFVGVICNKCNRNVS